MDDESENVTRPESKPVPVCSGAHPLVNAGPSTVALHIMYMRRRASLALVATLACVLAGPVAVHAQSGPAVIEAVRAGDLEAASNLLAAGADACLVGTAFLRAPDPAAELRRWLASP